MIPEFIADLPSGGVTAPTFALASSSCSGATYAFAVLLQEEAYWWALIPGAVLGLVSILEFVFIDIYVDSRFPRATTEYLERLEQKLATTTAHDEILAALNDCVDSFAACDKGQHLIDGAPDD